MIRLLDNLISILTYGIVFVTLLSIIGGFSARELVGYSLILGFFAGIINNIERVLRELFDKNYNKE